MPTKLETLFVERLRAELGDRNLSANALAKAAKTLGYKLGQTSVSRILEYKQSPTLQKVYEIADTLGVPAWYLLTAKDQVQQTVISPPVKKPLQNVVPLPRPYPKIFGKKSHSGQTGNIKGRKTPSKK